MTNSLEYKGYKAIQDLTNFHVGIHDPNGKYIAHFQSCEIKNEDELKEIIDFTIEMRAGQISNEQKIKYIIDNIEKFTNEHNLELYARYGELKEKFKIVIAEPLNVKKAMMFLIDINEIDWFEIDRILENNIFYEISKDFDFEY